MDNQKIHEETAQEFADRMGLETAGEFKRAFNHLKGKGENERNMILERDMGLVLDGTASKVLRDSETGEAIKEESLYAE